MGYRDVAGQCLALPPTVVLVGRQFLAVLSVGLAPIDTHLQQRRRLGSKMRCQGAVAGRAAGTLDRVPVDLGVERMTVSRRHAASSATCPRLSRLVRGTAFQGVIPFEQQPR